MSREEMVYVFATVHPFLVAPTNWLVYTQFVY
jgi:hypothetical protein